MPKPSLANTRWATDETNNTAPSSGQRDTGWENEQDAVSDYFNHLAKAYYDWFVYLDAGLWEDDLHVTGNLEVDGTTQLDDDLTLAVNKDVNLSGTGKYRHGLETISIPAVAGAPVSSSQVWDTSAGIGNVHFPSSAISWYIPIILPVGRRIVNVRGYVDDSTTGPTIIRMRVVQNFSDNTVGILGDQSSTGSGAPQILTQSAINHTTVTGSSYLCYFTTVSGSAPTTVYGIEVDYDFA